jgi:hypothetical protein
MITTSLWCCLEGTTTGDIRVETRQGMSAVEFAVREEQLVVNKFTCRIAKTRCRLVLAWLIRCVVVCPGGEQ